MSILRKTITFDDVSINFDKRIILWNGEPQKLTNQSWSLLEELVGASPNLLTTETINKRLWPDDMKMDTRGNNIRNVIHAIRKALHDAEPFHYVVGTPKLGYSFAVKYHIVENPTVQSIQNSKTHASNTAKKQMEVKWIDGSKKLITIYRELTNEDKQRHYLLFGCDEAYYCVQIIHNPSEKDEWRLVTLSDWIDLDNEKRKNELDDSILELKDSNNIIFDFVAGQKAKIDQLFVDYPQLKVYFDGKKALTPENDKQQDLCFAAATVIGSYLQITEPLLDQLPYHYACSILAWREKVLSSPVMQSIVTKVPWFWGFIFK